MDAINGMVRGKLLPDGTDTCHIHADSRTPQFRQATKLIFSMGRRSFSRFGLSVFGPSNNQLPPRADAAS
jgi:hypothetical protein